MINPKYKNKKIVLEGGSIDVNGSGYLLTTKQCLLSKVQQRNKGLTESDYYHIFNKYFGIKKIIWLNKEFVVMIRMDILMILPDLLKKIKYSLLRKIIKKTKTSGI